MNLKAFQDHYSDEISHCYGCGRNNEHGHQLKSYWDGDSTVSRFTPEPWHTSFPGYIYGGLIASLIDCHGTGSAAAAIYRVEDREMDTEPAVRMVTASLKVDFLAPTPQGVELELRSTSFQVMERKVVVDVTVRAEGEICARGQIVAVKAPESMMTGMKERDSARL